MNAIKLVLDCNRLLHDIATWKTWWFHFDATSSHSVMACQWFFKRTVHFKKLLLESHTPRHVNSFVISEWSHTFDFTMFYHMACRNHIYDSKTEWPWFMAIHPKGLREASEDKLTCYRNGLHDYIVITVSLFLPCFYHVFGPNITRSPQWWTEGISLQY